MHSTCHPYVCSRVEETGALMADLEKANQVSEMHSSQPLIETELGEDNHLGNQAWSLMRPPHRGPSSSSSSLAGRD